MSKEVLWKKSDGIGLITLNRPETLNAMSLELIESLYEVVEGAQKDEDVKVVVITGAGKGFCSGADLQKHPSLKTDDPLIKERYLIESQRIPVMIHRMAKPVIAAINGVALGGGLEVALGCDIRIASENAKLGCPEVKIGIVPGAGGVYRITRALSWCRAAEMLFTGKIVDAQEAYRIGLINQVTALSDLMPAAKQWAQTVCESAPLAVRAIKEVMSRSMNAPLEEGLRLEWSANRYLMRTEDSAEGHKAVSEKRKPVFKAK